MQNPYQPTEDYARRDPIQSECLIPRTWFILLLVADFAIIGSANEIATFWGTMGLGWDPFDLRFTFVSLLLICFTSTVAGLLAATTQDRIVRIPFNSLNFGFLLPLSVPVLIPLISYLTYLNVGNEIYYNLPPVPVFVLAGVFAQICFVSKVTGKMTSPQLPLLIAAGFCYAFGLAPAWLHLSLL